MLNDAFATGRGVPMMAEYDDTATSLPSADDRVLAEGLRNIAAYVNLRDNPGNEIGTSANWRLVESMARAPRYGNRERGHNGHARDLVSGEPHRAIARLTFLALAYQPQLKPGPGTQLLRYAADGSMNCRTGSPDGTLASAVYLSTDANRYVNTGVQSIVERLLSNGPGVCHHNYQQPLFLPEQVTRCAVLANHSNSDIFLGTRYNYNVNWLDAAWCQGARFRFRLRRPLVG